jgi:Leucine-rich repeat (LRR) protein
MATNDNLLAPPDPTLFIRAGTSGVRHLFPIHLTDSNCHGDLFSRPISRLRSRTPTTELCTNIEMIRNICSSIPTLEHFDISENELDNLPLDICLLINLETLNCSHNQLTAIPDLFDQLNQLKELDLSFNIFKRLPPVIYTFEHLIRLNCEHNFIKIIDSDFLKLQNLKTLILDHNQLQSLDTIDFSQMKKLEYVHIAHNQLIKFPLNLQKLTHLKNVNLSHNQLTSFPIELLLINCLDVLNLNHNFLTKLPPLPDTYKRTSLIFSIDLSFNQLTKFHDYLLLISLKLDLSNNKIQSIPNELIRKLSHDMIKNRELKISNNPLIQPTLPTDSLNDARNILQIIRNCFDEQQIDETVRQGFKICITGCKKSGKSLLAYCLEEIMPLIPDEKEERIVNSK